MTISVAIPTYHRASDLDRCLSGLAQQERLPDEVAVIVRREDYSSMEVINRWKQSMPIVVLTIDRPGVVQALNLALDHVQSEIVTITDDDTFALPNWLQLIESHFLADPMLGGLGGRDLIHQDGGILPPNRSRVGMILWFGRVTGDHHLGFGRPRMVHHLKGVNMSWRRSAIASRRFPEEMRGQGAQVYFEFAFSLSIAREGWKLVYDPEVQVHHFVGRRFDDDQRVNVSTQVLAEAAFNFYVSLLRYMQQGWRRHAAITWAYCVGAPKYPGRVRGLAFALRGDARGAALRREVSKAWSDAKELTTNDRASATARQFGLLNKKDVP